MIGLLEVVQASAEHKILADRVGAIAAGEDHFEPGPLRPEFFRQLPPIQTVGHDQIRKQQVNLFFALAPDLEGSCPGFGLQHTVPVPRQHAANQLADRRFILNHQDSFGAAARGLLVRLILGNLGDFTAQGYEDLERRASADFALNLDPTLVLFDDAVNGGKAETGALADFLG